MTELVTGRGDGLKPIPGLLLTKGDGLIVVSSKEKVGTVEGNWIVFITRLSNYVLSN